MIAIIKYQAGNIRSVQNALTRLGQKSTITDDPEEIMRAQKVIFPGVGEASSAMYYLKEKKLDALIPALKQPVLGICLGLQLMCMSSEEGPVACMEIFDTIVKKFPPDGIVPQMGWNNFETISGVLLQDVALTEDVYYVHSYYAEVCDDTTAVCNYILPFSAAMQKENFYATQFHPEKSGLVGERILQNFLNL